MAKAVKDFHRGDPVRNVGVHGTGRAASAKIPQAGTHLVVELLCFGVEGRGHRLDIGFDESGGAHISLLRAGFTSPSHYRRPVKREPGRWGGGGAAGGVTGCALRTDSRVSVGGPTMVMVRTIRVPHRRRLGHCGWSAARLKGSFVTSVNLGMPAPPPPVLAPRRKTRQINVGKVGVGSDSPVSVQSMTTTQTTDINGTLQQIAELTAAGCDIVRVACPTADDARPPIIAGKSQIPVIADIHFQPKYVFAAMTPVVRECASTRQHPNSTIRSKRYRRLRPRRAYPSASASTPALSTSG